MTLLADGIRVLGLPVLAVAAYQDYQSQLVRRDLWYIIAWLALTALAVDMAATGGVVVLATQALSAALVTGAIGAAMVYAGAGKADGLALAVVGLWWPHSVGGLVLGALAGLLALCVGVLVAVEMRTDAVDSEERGIPFVTVLAPSVGLAVGLYLIGVVA